MFNQDAVADAPGICVSERKYELSLGTREYRYRHFMPAISTRETCRARWIALPVKSSEPTRVFLCLYSADDVSHRRLPSELP